MAAIEWQFSSALPLKSCDLVQAFPGGSDLLPRQRALIETNRTLALGVVFADVGIDPDYS